MSKWILKWRTDDLSTPYFVSITAEYEARWSARQREANRFGSVGDARNVADLWKGKWRPRIIRLVPKVPS